jgi:folate-binding protein YgfZ
MTDDDFKKKIILPNHWGFCLPERRIVQVRGTDMWGFLQGLVTNDIKNLSLESIIYTAILTPQGKYLLDFFIINVSRDALDIDIESSCVDDLVAKLEMYSLSREISFEVLPQTVFQLYPHPSFSAEPKPIDNTQINEICAEEGARVFVDPRNSCLGVRVYYPCPITTRDTANAIQLQNDGKNINVDEGSFTLLRIRHLIPERHTELVPEQSYILEYGFEKIHGVSFRKGCYVGQEIIARMHHKATLHKGLYCVKASVPLPETGQEIMCGEKVAGRLCSVFGHEGIAHLNSTRIADAQPLVADNIELDLNSIRTTFPCIVHNIQQD